jgi:hypothetical protein
MKLATLETLPRFFDTLLRETVQKDRRNRKSFEWILSHFREESRTMDKISVVEWRRLKPIWTKNAEDGVGC